MAWENRKGRRYYYRSRKVRGRVVREYVGTGEVAEVAARLDAEAANVRVLRRIERLRTQTELEELDAMLEQIDCKVNAIVSVAMTLAGFHWHRGEWRRIRNMPTSDTPAASPTPPVDPATEAKPPTSAELLQRARNGDVAAMEQLRPMLLDAESVNRLGGDVAMRSIQFAISRMVGKDLVSEEAIQRKMELLRVELAGPNPTAMERLLAERIVTMWLHLHRVEGEFAIVGDDDPGRAGYYQRAITSAQERYFRAIRELTRQRRAAAPPMQVNIAHEQVNVMNAPKE